MSPEFRRRMEALLAAHYGIAPDALDRPGMTLVPVAPEQWDDWLELFTGWRAVGVEVPPALRARSRRWSPRTPPIAG